MGAVSRPHLFSYNCWLCRAVSQDARTFFVFRNQSCLIDQQLLNSVPSSCHFNCLERTEFAYSPEVHVQEKDMFSAVHVPIRYDPIRSKIATICSVKFVRLNPLSLLYVTVQFRPYLHPLPGSGASTHLGLLPCGMVVTRSPIKGLRSGLS